MEYVDARDDDEYLAALANMGDLSDIDDDIRPSAWSPSFSECSDHTYATVGLTSLPNRRENVDLMPDMNAVPVNICSRTARALFLYDSCKIRGVFV